MLIRLALKNLLRNRRRSAVTISTTLVASAIVMLSVGMLNGTYREMAESFTLKMTGDVQLNRAGYRENVSGEPFGFLFEWDESLQSDVLAVEGIVAATPRLETGGLVNNQRLQKTAPMPIIGLDPDSEPKVLTRQYEAIDGAFMVMPEGADPEPNMVPILLTKDAMEGLKLGEFSQGGQSEGLEDIVITLQDQDGITQQIVGKAVGSAGHVLPDFFAAGFAGAYVPIDALQRALGVGQNVSQVMIRTETRDFFNVQPFASAVDRVLPANVEAQTWMDAAGDIAASLQSQDAINASIVFIIFVLVAMVIVNTSLMSVMERTREIGTLKALGYREGTIRNLFLVEALMIGLIGGILGGVIGQGLVWLLAEVEIKIEYTTMDSALVIVPEVDPGFAGAVALIAVISAVVAAWLPARRAARMRPVEALAAT